MVVIATPFAPKGAESEGGQNSAYGSLRFLTSDADF